MYELDCGTEPGASSIFKCGTVNSEPGANFTCMLLLLLKQKKKKIINTIIKIKNKMRNLMPVMVNKQKMSNAKHINRRVLLHCAILINNKHFCKQFHTVSWKTSLMSFMSRLSHFQHLWNKVKLFIFLWSLLIDTWELKDHLSVASAKFIQCSQREKKTVLTQYSQESAVKYKLMQYANQ